MGNRQSDNRSYVSRIASTSGTDYKNKGDSEISRRNIEIREKAISAFDRMTRRKVDGA